MSPFSIYFTCAYKYYLHFPVFKICLLHVILAGRLGSLSQIALRTKLNRLICCSSLLFTSLHSSILSSFLGQKKWKIHCKTRNQIQTKDVKWKPPVIVVRLIANHKPRLAMIPSSVAKKATQGTALSIFSLKASSKQFKKTLLWPQTNNTLPETDLTLSKPTSRQP